MNQQWGFFIFPPNHLQHMLNRKPQKLAWAKQRGRRIWLFKIAEFLQNRVFSEFLGGFRHEMPVYYQTYGHMYVFSDCTEDDQHKTTNNWLGKLYGKEKMALKMADFSQNRIFSQFWVFFYDTKYKYIIKHIGIFMCFLIVQKMISTKPQKLGWQNYMGRRKWL